MPTVHSCPSARLPWRGDLACICQGMLHAVLPPHRQKPLSGEALSNAVQRDRGPAARNSTRRAVTSTSRQSTLSRVGRTAASSGWCLNSGNEMHDGGRGRPSPLQRSPGRCWRRNSHLRGCDCPVSARGQFRPFRSRLANYSLPRASRVQEVAPHDCFLGRAFQRSPGRTRKNHSPSQSATAFHAV